MKTLQEQIIEAADKDYDKKLDEYTRQAFIKGALFGAKLGFEAARETFTVDGEMSAYEEEKYETFSDLGLEGEDK